MKLAKRQFLHFIKTQQWELAATVSVRSLQNSNQREISWYANALMDTCNRWRVVRMVRTWLNNGVPLSMDYRYGERFHRDYGPLIFQMMRKTERWEKFVEERFVDYELVDPLTLWITLGKDPIL